MVIVMGVSGCGKTTVAQSLASQLGIQSLDADDFHSETNKAHMASGLPLTDDMRLPWVKTLRAHLEALSRTHKSCTLAFSGLRKEHRDLLRISEANVRFLHLHGSKELILARMKTREDHFMPTSLLDSQFAALEAPNEHDIIPLDIDQPLNQLVENALIQLKQSL